MSVIKKPDIQYTATYHEYVDTCKGMLKCVIKCLKPLADNIIVDCEQKQFFPFTQMRFIIEENYGNKTGKV